MKTRSDSGTLLRQQLLDCNPCGIGKGHAPKLVVFGVEVEVRLAARVTGEHDQGWPVVELMRTPVMFGAHSRILYTSQATCDITHLEIAMNRSLIAAALLCGSGYAQGIDANLVREVAAVRAEIARSLAALRQYTWSEETEVLVSGSVKSTSSYTCMYDGSGELMKAPLGSGQEMKPGSATSNRPRVRGRADLRDYIERAVSRIHNYVPPDPKQIDYLVRKGYASLGQTANGKSEIRLTHYFVDDDSLLFTYDSTSKVLLNAVISSSLGSPKDPVLLEATFETLADGANHLSSATLNAKARKVLVRTRNFDYRKAGP